MVIRVRKHDPVPIDGDVVHAVRGDHSIAHQLDVVSAEAQGGVEEVPDRGAANSGGQGYVDVGARVGRAPASVACDGGRGAGEEEGTGGEEAGWVVLVAWDG